MPYLRFYGLSAAGLGIFLLLMIVVSVPAHAIILCIDCKEKVSELDNGKLKCMSQGCPKYGIEYPKDAYFVCTSSPAQIDSHASALDKDDKSEEGTSPFPPFLLSGRIAPG